MNATDIDSSSVVKFDPILTERMIGLIRPVVKGWHRAEGRGLNGFPGGGALVVANRSAAERRFPGIG